MTQNKNQRIKLAAELFEDFTGHDPEYIDTIDLPIHDVGLIVGECLGIMYETVRDGKREQYVHKFKKKARPVLAASFDGSQLYVLAGAYTFTPAGITDKE